MPAATIETKPKFLTDLSGEDEFEFQTQIRMLEWYKQYQNKFGEIPDLNNPNYDYRGAWLAGEGPQDIGDGDIQQWPSKTSETFNQKLLRNPNPTVPPATKQGILSGRIAEFQARNDPSARQPAAMTRKQLLDNQTARFILKIDEAMVPISAEDKAAGEIDEQIQTADVTKAVDPNRDIRQLSIGPLQKQQDIPPSTFIRLATPVLRGVSESTPDFVKQAYNQSITGMVHQLISGEEAFDLSGYNPNVIEDIAATVLSFVMPVDVITLGVTGAAGGLIVRQAGKVAFKTLLKAGVKKEIAEKAAERAVTRIFANAVTSGIRLGGYTGTLEATRQWAQDDKFDLETIYDASFSGGALGFILGASGTAINPLVQRLAAKGQLGKVAGTGLALGTEIGAFGTGGAVLEGRMPTQDDYIHAVGIVIGLKFQSAVGRRVKNAVGGYLAGKEIVDPKLRDIIEKTAERLMEKVGLGEMTIEEAIDELSREDLSDVFAVEDRPTTFREVPKDFGLEPGVQGKLLKGLSDNELRDELLRTVKEADVDITDAEIAAMPIEDIRFILGATDEPPPGFDFSADVGFRERKGAGDEPEIVAEVTFDLKTRKIISGQKEPPGQKPPTKSGIRIPTELPDDASRAERTDALQQFLTDLEADFAKTGEKLTKAELLEKLEQVLKNLQLLTRRKFIDDFKARTNFELPDPRFREAIAEFDRLTEFKIGDTKTLELLSFTPEQDKSIKQITSDLLKKYGGVFPVDQEEDEPPEPVAEAKPKRKPIKPTTIETGPMTSLRLNRETQSFRGTGGIASELEGKVRSAAFRDSETGEVFETGAIHNLEKLPEKALSGKEEDGFPIGKPSLESGFVMNDGTFKTRQEVIDLKKPEVDEDITDVFAEPEAEKKKADKPKRGSIIERVSRGDFDTIDLDQKQTKKLAGELQRIVTEAQDLIGKTEVSNLASFRSARDFIKEIFGTRPRGDKFSDGIGFKDAIRLISLVDDVKEDAEKFARGEETKDGRDDFEKQQQADLDERFKDSAVPEVGDKDSFMGIPSKLLEIEVIDDISYGLWQPVAKDDFRRVIHAKDLDSGKTISVTEYKTANAANRAYTELLADVRERAGEPEPKKPRDLGDLVVTDLRTGKQDVIPEPEAVPKKRVRVEYDSGERRWKIRGQPGTFATEEAARVRAEQLGFEIDDRTTADLAKERLAKQETSKTNDLLISLFQDRITKGELPSKPAELIRLARSVDDKLEASKDNDRIFDALEVALNREYSDRVKDITDPAERMKIAQEMEAILPTRRRSLEAGSLERQQFSTPLTIAEAMFQLARIKESDLVFEPTAGTGNLVAPLNRKQFVMMNEKFDERADLLEFGSKRDVTREDYLTMKAPDAAVVLMNPPWASPARSKLVRANKSPDLAALFVDKAIRDMQDGGRLVALLPTTMLPRSQRAGNWWRNLAAENDILAVISTPENAYTAARGTNIESFIVVLDKGKRPGDRKATIVHIGDHHAEGIRGFDVEEIRKALDRILDVSVPLPLPEFGNIIKAAENDLLDRKEITDATARPDTRVPEIPGQEQPSPTVRPVRPGEPGQRPVRQGELPGGREGVGQPEVRPEPTTPAGVVPGEQQRLPKGVDRVSAKLGKIVERRRITTKSIDSDVFIGYLPQYKAGAGNRHPRQLVITKSALALGLPDINNVKLHKNTLDMNKRPDTLSDEQLDFVARAEQTLDSGKPFLHAHDVGVGKTHVAVAHITEWLSTGKATQILYVTANEQNVRDVMDKLDNLSPGGKFPWNIVHIPSENKESSVRFRGVQVPILKQPNTVYIIQSGSYSDYHKRMLELKVDAFIGDEAHKFRNPGSIRGAMWVQMQADLIQRGARRIYMTATSAREIEEIEYLSLDWKPGQFENWVDRVQGRKTIAKEDELPALTPGDVEKIIEGAKKGTSKLKSIGKTTRTQFTTEHAEQLIREFHAKGLMFASDLHRDGIEFDATVTNLTETERVVIDNATDLLRDVRKHYRDFGKANEAFKKPYGIEAGIQNLVKAMLYDKRLDYAITRVKKALADGEQAVISVIFVKGEPMETGEGGIERAKVEATEMDPTAGIPKTMMSIINDINDRVVTKEGDDLGEIPEAVLAKQRLIEKAQEVWPVFIDPVARVQKAFGEGNVAVITGTVSIKRRIQLTKEFQEGKRKVAFISGAGKTGINLDDINGARRHLFVTDYDWDPAVFKQEMGRVDRSAQVSAPKISVMNFGLAGERRFIGGLANKMKSLGATAKGAAKSTGTGALEGFEFGGKLDYAALKQTWFAMPRELKDRFVNMSEFRDTNGEPVYRLSEVGFSTLTKFFRNFQTMPLAEAKEVEELFAKELKEVQQAEAAEELRALEKLGADVTLYADAIESGSTFLEIQQKLHRTGTITRTVDLVPGELKIYQVKADDGAEYSVIEGLITDHLPNLRPFLPIRDGVPHQKIIEFRGKEGSIFGLQVNSIKSMGIAKAFNIAGIGDKITLKNLDVALQSGEFVPLSNGWEIYQGQGGERKGKFVVKGPKTSTAIEETADGKKRTKFGLILDNAGFYHIPKDKLTEFVKLIGLGQVVDATEVNKSNLISTRTINPNIDDSQFLGSMGGINPKTLLPTLTVKAHQLLRDAISSKQAERNRLPEITIEDAPKDVGISQYIVTPSFLMGAIPGMVAKYGQPAMRAVRAVILTQMGINIESGRRLEADLAMVKAIPKKDFGKLGEKFIDIFDGKPIDDILNDPDIQPQTKRIAEYFRKKFDGDREERIKIGREVWRIPIAKKTERDFKLEMGIQGELSAANRKTVKDLVEEALDEIFPRNWGIRDYFPHLFPGDFRIVRELEDGTTEFVTSAKNKLEALAKIAEDFAERQDDFNVVGYNVKKRLFIEPDVVRISGPRYNRVVKELQKSTEITRPEIRDAMKGILGKKENKQKFFFAFKKRKGFLGFSKDLRETLTAYNIGYTRWKHLTRLNSRIQPLLLEISKEGRPNTKTYVENLFNQLWGMQTASSRSFDAALQKIPWIKDRIMPFALDRWLNMAKTATYLGFLGLSPKFHLINSTQLIQTTLPLVDSKTFLSGLKSVMTADGRRILHKYGLRFMTAGKLAEIDSIKDRIGPGNPERFNQETVFLIMFNHAKQLGMKENDAARYAFLRGNIFSQFAFVGSDRPMFTKGPILSSIFLFRRFQIKDLEMAYTLLQSKEYRGFAKWLGAHLMFGGVKSFSSGYGPILRAFGKAYIPYQLYQQLQEETNETFANLVAFGLPSLINMDLSYTYDLINVGFGKDLPEQTFNILTGPMASTTYKVFNDALNTKGVVESPSERATRSLIGRTPALRWLLALESLLKSADDGKYELTTATGKKKFEAELKDIIVIALGGRPLIAGKQDFEIDAGISLVADRAALVDKMVLRFIATGRYPEEFEKERQRWQQMWGDVSYLGREDIVDAKNRRLKNATKATIDRIISQKGRRMTEKLIEKDDGE